MQEVSFCAGTKFLTGDAIAGEVIAYAQALARTAEYDVVRVPTRREDGSPGHTTLLIGPVSQIASTSMDSTDAEVIDDELVARLRARTARLLEPHQIVFEPAEARLPADLYDL
jgi:hypothetical protein